ncbi:hypothetical protein VKT23_014059 [Stygiomarasmius scandens]|uniref:Uncharacterized protein n=1 Tax=Marasmiellus scandens TaxID=2682957 RepID=A0ABR1J3M5_9AGAR
MAPRMTRTRMGRNRATDKEARDHLGTIYAYGSSWYHCTRTEFHRCGNTYIIQDASYTRSNSYFSCAKVQQYTYPRPHSIPSSTENTLNSLLHPHPFLACSPKPIRQAQKKPPRHTPTPLVLVALINLNIKTSRMGQKIICFFPLRFRSEFGDEDTRIERRFWLGGYCKRGLLGWAVYNHH